MSHLILRWQNQHQPPPAATRSAATSCNLVEPLPGRAATRSKKNPLPDIMPSNGFLLTFDNRRLSRVNAIMYYLIPNIRYILCIKYYIIYAFLTSPPAAALCSLLGLLLGLLLELLLGLLGLLLLGKCRGGALAGGGQCWGALRPRDTHRARHKQSHLETGRPPPRSCALALRAGGHRRNDVVLIFISI